jgi:hypothetical protein
MDFLAQIVVWLNAVANDLGKWILAPIAFLPGWLSATVIAAATGVMFLIIFKYTSSQQSIKRVKDDIKANLLALKLFKESARVALSAQARTFLGAGWLLTLGLMPMLVLLVPALLILGQLGLWYQARPLRIGEEAVVTVKLNIDPRSAWPEVQLLPTDGVAALVGPVQVRSQGELCWSIRAIKSGYERLVFQVGEQTADKELAVGDGFLRVSSLRPGWRWLDALLYPAENPFPPGSTIQSIAIDYPKRSSWTSGTDSWVIYWFLMSMVSGFCFRRWLNVNI